MISIAENSPLCVDYIPICSGTSTSPWLPQIHFVSPILLSTEVNHFCLIFTCCLRLLWPGACCTLTYILLINLCVIFTLKILRSSNSIAISYNTYASNTLWIFMVLQKTWGFYVLDWSRRRVWILSKVCQLLSLFVFLTDFSPSTFSPPTHRWTAKQPLHFISNPHPMPSSPSSSLSPGTTPLTYFAESEAPEHGPAPS
jgi:hypothetical protein